MLNITMIDHYMGQHGQFNLLDWLISENLLAYSDYEQWRYGKTPYLSQSISLEKHELQTLCKISTQLCKKLKLHESNQYFFAWNNPQQKHLKIDIDTKLQAAFCQKWLRPQDVPQLDLFMDNSAIITENRLCDTLVNRQFDDAQPLIKTLTALNPNNTKLGGYQSLILYSQHITHNSLIQPEHLASEIAGLEEEVLPLAKNLLQDGARDYLAIAWQRIGRHLEAIPYCANTPKLHASYAFAQIPDWQSVVQCLLNNPTTYQNAELMVRLADALYGLNDIAKSRFCWILIVERYPQEAQIILEKAPPMCLSTLWENYCEQEERWPILFFACFMLASTPVLIFESEYFPAFEHLATQHVAHLINKKLAGENEITARQHLQDYNPALLHMVINT